MLIISVAFIIAGLVLALTLYLRNLKFSYSYFKDRSISTPPFELFFGHYRKLWSDPFLSRLFQTWTKQYGSIYGLYEGTRPVYVVSNVEFLQEAFVKQFSLFNSRRVPFIARLSNGNHVHLFGADADRWHRQRNIINPTFTNTKLKLMTTMINDCIDTFIEKIKQKENQELDIYPYLRQLLMDIICRCAFGLDTDVQHNPNNPFLVKAAKFFRDNHEKLFLVKIGYLLPWLIPLLTQIIRIQFAIFMGLRFIVPSWMNHFEELPGFWIINQVKSVINERIQKRKQSKRIDLLQLMLDAASSDEVKNHRDEHIMSKKLHYDEVTSNVFLFMVAGYDTTSTTLAYSSYILATRPDIQEKLQEQIDKVYANNENADYDQVNNLEYLDYFVRELLRMFPIAIQAISRECGQDTIICGYSIRSGDVIQPDVYSLHYDPDLWGPDDPQEFIPERHSVRRHPMCYMAFGQGPRNCIGMRFGLMSIKLCLVRLLRQYTIVSTEKTRSNFTIRETLIIQPDAVFVKFQKRHFS